MELLQLRGTFRGHWVQPLLRERLGLFGAICHWKEKPWKSGVIAGYWVLQNVENTFTGHETSPIPLPVEQVAIAKYVHCSQTNYLVFPANFEPLTTFYGFCLLASCLMCCRNLWLFLSPHSAWRCLQEPLITRCSWKVSGLQLCSSRVPGTLDMILWVPK